MTDVVSASDMQVCITEALSTSQPNTLITVLYVQTTIISLSHARFTIEFGKLIHQIDTPDDFDYLA